MDNKIEFHFRNPEESSGYLLWQVSMRWQLKMKRSLDTLNLTHTQFALLAALAWLSRTEKIVTQIDIANHSHTDRMMVSKVLRTLETKGFIHREEHSDDTRAKVISLSNSGREILQQALKIVEETDNKFFSSLQSNTNSFNSILLRLINGNSDTESPYNRFK